MKQLSKLFDKPKKPENCLCSVIKPILFWAKLTGILPIATLPKNNKARCRFGVSKNWKIYSIFVIVVYLVYFFAAYAMRMFCPKAQPEHPEWYVMTIGYFITDLDSLVTLIFGVISTKKICLLLEKLSSFTTSTREIKTCKTHLSILRKLLQLYFIVSLLSYIFVSIRRFDLTKTLVLGCSCLGIPVCFLDTTFAVFLRGFTVVSIVYTLCYLIGKKFEYLADIAASTIEKISQNLHEPQGTSSEIIVKSSPSQTIEGNFLQLEYIAVMHQEIFRCLEAVNSCMGVQLLITNTSSLYTSMFYLYRYITARESSRTSNSHEKFHYVIGFFCRLLKMFIYVILGRKVYTKSKLPIRVLQQSQVIQFPQNIQQQIQTLLIQWYGREGYLSAIGVVRMGPWLLAPIAGNVVTYLLVILQFDQNSQRRVQNATTISSLL